MPFRLRSPGEKDQNGIDGTDPFAAKPAPGLITPFERDTRPCEGVPFAALAQREGVSRSYFMRLVCLGYPRRSSMGGSRAI